MQLMSSHELKIRFSCVFEGSAILVCCEIKKSQLPFDFS